MKGTSRPHRYFTEDEIRRAKELRAAGLGWSSVGARLGCSDETIRSRIDPGFKRVRADKYRGPKSGLRNVERRFLPGEEDRVIAAVPIDTRSRLARWFGDPPAGRSALDQKRAATRVFPSINTVHTDGNKSGVADPKYTIAP